MAKQSIPFTPAPFAILIASLLITLIPTHAHAQQRQQRDPFSPASLAVEPPSLHLGDVRPGQSITRSVTLTNNADRELTLIRTATSCACTVPDLGQRRTLQPGDSIELPITYTGFDEHFGETAQQVVVFIEGFSIPTQIAVNANINRGIRPTINYTPPDQYRTAEITLESVNNKPFRIESVNQRTPIHLDGFDPANDQPRSSYTISQDFTDLQPDEIPPYLLIVTDDPDSPVISLRVINLEYEPPRIRRPFIIEQAPVLIHAIPAMGITEAEIQLMAVRGEPHQLLEWFEATSQHATITLLGVRTDPEKSLAYLRIGIRPYPTHQGLITINAWATINGHTEHTILHGRVFPTEKLPAQQPSE